MELEESVRQAKFLSKRVKTRVEKDVEIVYERSKTILEHWDVMRFMDSVWTARETTPEKHPCANLRPYLIGASWALALLLMYIVYYVDVDTTPSLFWYVSIRSAEITCLSLIILCLLCCFEQGLNLVMGGLFLVSVYWAAPPKKRNQNGRAR